MSARLAVAAEAGSTFVGWYPVALSADVPDDEVVGRDVLGTRVAVFRASGRPVVLGAFCAHLGADMTIGVTKDGELECPYHHFRYGSDGVCTWVPGEGGIPSGARVQRFPAEERYGVIWAHNGPSPLHGLPHWPGHELATDDAVVVKVWIESYATEPWVILANTYDYLHLKELHGLDKVLTPSDITRVDEGVLELEIGWDMPGFGAMTNRSRTFGTNTNFTVTQFGDVEMLVGFSGTPTDPGRCDVFNFVACADTSNGDEGRLAELRDHLDLAQSFVERLVSDDRGVFNTIRFRQGVSLPDDRALNWFLRFVRDFPTHDASAFDTSPVG
jgi:nitrite reductase/ring-hydroxylating ferredoxin subunit